MSDNQSSNIDYATAYLTDAQKAFNQSTAAPQTAGQLYGQSVRAMSNGGNSGGGMAGYTSKELAQLREALNQGAAVQTAAINSAVGRAETTATANTDYFKELAQYSASLFAPYVALGQQSSKLLMDSIGANGVQAQQASMNTATSIFKQQGINATPFLASIPNWSFNTASNQASSMMNSMFGYGTNQPQTNPNNQLPQQSQVPVGGTQQQQQPYQYQLPPSSGVAGVGPQPTYIAGLNPQQAVAPNPFETTAQKKARTDAEAEYAAGLKALQGKETGWKSGYATKLAEYERLRAAADNKIPLTKIGEGGAWRQDAIDLYTQRNIEAERTNRANREAFEKFQLANPGMNQDTLKRQIAADVNPFTAQVQAFKDVPIQAQAAQQAKLAAQQAKQQQAYQQQMQGQAQFNQQDLALQAPQLQSSENQMMNSLIGNFQQAQNNVSNVAGNTLGTMGQITEQAKQFGDSYGFTDLLRNEISSRPDAGQYANDVLNQLIDPAQGAVNNWMNSGVVKDVMNATVGAGTNAVQNAQAARGMLNSGQTLAELQRVGTNAAGQYIVPYAGQLANNVMSQGVATANNRLNNYYSLLGKGADFANQQTSNAMQAGTALYNNNLNQANSLSQAGLGFANNIMNAQLGLTQNLANKYSDSANQFLNTNMTTSAASSLGQQGMLSQSALNGQNASGNISDVYSQLGQSSAGQGIYAADAYGTGQLNAARIEADRLAQDAQLAIKEKRAKAASSSGGLAALGGGSLLGMAMMAAGGGL